ncbi:hypothetical protein SVIOM74S_00527 [Streptomyces violarus]
MRRLEPSSLAATAIPTATGNPCPSGPVLVSTPGTFRRLGWPLSGDSGSMNVVSSASGKKPACARAEYRMPAAWPLLSTNRSRSAHSGSSGADVEHREVQNGDDVGGGMEVAVVGHGDVRHAHLVARVEHVLQPRGTVQQRVLGVDVQVRERRL